MPKERLSQHFCTKCGRVVLSIDKRIDNWLVSENGQVVRCPQHITDWSMRQAGKKRTKDSYRWRRIAKETDVPPLHIALEPFYDL
jgi:N-glycosylase/DNA lyase